LDSPQAKWFAMGKFNQANFDDAVLLMRRVLVPFLDHPKELELNVTTMGNTAFIQVTVHSEDYANVYGTDADFSYGRDGNLIGAIKNIFDGIGKNHGRIVRVVLNRK
jgi:predicted RNA-binding protein YlqC (UPF0109 family)